ncbi:hypothetical protein MJK72_06065 [Klebsiella pneumoniae]|nr:hypothetical protein MJK72_06065 [Klebsiella pneumoniae]
MDGIGNGLGYGAILIIVGFLREGLSVAASCSVSRCWKRCRTAAGIQPNGLFLLAPSALLHYRFADLGPA